MQYPDLLLQHRSAVHQVLLSPARLARLPSWLGEHVHSHVYLRLSISRCQPPWLVTRPPGPSVQASHSSFTAPGLLARYVPTWPSPRHRPPSPSSTPAHHKPKDMSHSPTHTIVSHKLNLGRGLRWQSLITKWTTRAHINLVFAVHIVFSGLEGGLSCYGFDDHGGPPWNLSELIRLLTL
jgi:hypothetical protein